MEREQQDHSPDSPLRTTVRDGVAIVFRHRRLVAASLASMLLTTALAAFLQPARYEARVKLLVRRDRVDSPVTPTREVLALATTTVSEEELQSEVQILTSRDLLVQVARACRIESAQILPSLHAVLQRLAGRAPADPLDGAVRHLERWVDVGVLKKSHVLAVSYADPDSSRARCVLDTLSASYLQKHLALGRPAGAFAFFKEETKGYQAELSRLKSRLAALNREAGVASPDLEKELTVRTLREAEAAVFDLRGNIAEVRERIRTLQGSLASVPPRRTTQVRKADNGPLMEQLQSNLLALEQKRTELLTRYAPAYRLVREVEQQIAQARKVIDDAAASPLRDETTDNDPTYEWVRTELTRAEADLAALQARERASARTVQAYQQKTRALADRSLEYEELVRQVKAEEESYLLYLRKREEARISEALDQQRISNVAVTEPVNVSGTPTSHRAVVLLLGVFFSLLGSVLLAVVVDAWDPSFRTPAEVASTLGVPVLASLPRMPGS